MPPKTLDPSTSAAAFYGWNLREERLRMNLTQRRLGAAVHVTNTRIAQIERATGAPPTLDNSRTFDHFFKKNSFFESLWQMVRRERFPDKYRRFVTPPSRNRGGFSLCRLGFATGQPGP
ncbi:helix-turn-helix domain-containing protein [Streptomyces sp. NPDC052396]|uniref:helix-turn-helix domain-containing protein n=1 Tax=Streptomyces sp. NPDC052396 TaxID=3365689 RepID=UPI0037D020C9